MAVFQEDSKRSTRNEWLPVGWQANIGESESFNERASKAQANFVECEKYAFASTFASNVYRHDETMPPARRNQMTDTIAFKLNGKGVRLETDGNRLLLWVLRTDYGLTGTKFGCAEGHCGACTVLVDGIATRSCLLKVKDIKDKEVVTIEGLGKDGKLHPLQKAFMEKDALQCGFCTPGMILTGVAFLKTHPEPTR